MCSGIGTLCLLWSVKFQSLSVVPIVVFKLVYKIVLRFFDYFLCCQHSINVDTTHGMVCSRLQSTETQLIRRFVVVYLCIEHMTDSSQKKYRVEEGETNTSARKWKVFDVGR